MYFWVTERNELLLGSIVAFSCPLVFFTLANSTNPDFELSDLNRSN
jgi:hypothetical protein